MFFFVFFGKNWLIIVYPKSNVVCEVNLTKDNRNRKGLANPATASKHRREKRESGKWKLISVQIYDFMLLIPLSFLTSSINAMASLSLLLTLFLLASSLRTSFSDRWKLPKCPPISLFPSSFLLQFCYNLEEKNQMV